ncbi:unnamed protein product [Gongylonema pulchrum]|uniref:Transmembrane protein n=1 Tax=Gongylonema pulchrum TaxID=637853 RepID=A0A183DGF6_9BILA|nr:unnamed protein product [Gongylonema pulchrum]
MAFVSSNNNNLVLKTKNSLLERYRAEHWKRKRKLKVGKEQEEEEEASTGFASFILFIAFLIYVAFGALLLPLLNGEVSPALRCFVPDYPDLLG